jgi:hypothetical protein
VTPTHSSTFIVSSGSLLWGNPRLLLSPTSRYLCEPHLGLYLHPHCGTPHRNIAKTLINFYETQNSFLRLWLGLLNINGLIINLFGDLAHGLLSPPQDLCASVANIICI